MSRDADLEVVQLVLADVRRGDVLLGLDEQRVALNDAVVNTRSKRAGFQARTPSGTVHSMSGDPDTVVHVLRDTGPGPTDHDDHDDDAQGGPCGCDPVGVHEVAERLGVVRGTVDQWRARGVGFPEPRWTVGNRPAWDWPDVAAWAAATGRV